MLIFKREIETKIKESLFKGSMVIILGPRQSGKTTLSKRIVGSFGDDGSYFNCEFIEVRAAFKLGEPKTLKSIIGGKKIVVFDEAQTIENIGKVLKVFHDTYPEVQIIATGSSSFDLSNKIKEPLTGRAIEFTLPPLSLAEIKKVIPITIEKLDEIIRYGSYPAIVGAATTKEKELELKKIATNYLYKDIFIFESIRNPKMFEDLLKILATSIGSTVSAHKLSIELGTTSPTVERYIRLLEQSFVIKRIYSYSKHFANELKKSYKIYFLDTGIRNALTQNFTSVLDRSDKGALFENYFIIEKYKTGSLETFPPYMYFWRTKQGLEIDLITEKDNKLKAFECKFSHQPVSFSVFLKHYPGSETELVTFSLMVQGRTNL